MKNVITVLKGALSAGITAAGASVVGTFVNPETFNLEEGLTNLAILAATSGVGGVINYIKQSPISAGWIMRAIGKRIL